MSEQTKEEWLAGLPAHVREVAERLSCDECYRSKSEPAGHFAIVSFEERGELEVTLKICHGRDSTRPALIVTGVPVNDVVPCGCGKWQMPTDQQVAELTEALERLRAFGLIH